MGIDWTWIHQRPQILAEMLANDYEITVLYPRSILKLGLPLPVHEGMKFRVLWTLPYQEKSSLIGWFARIINYKKIATINEFQYVYVGYPLYGRYIPRDYKGKIIYDCMDNHEALYPDFKRVDKVLVQEQILVQRADLLIGSADALVKKMNSIAGSDRCQLLRNGVDVEKSYDIKVAVKKEKYKIGYIGTIAEWFDYKLLIEGNTYLKNIDYHLIGPVAEQVEHTAIHYEGIVEHDMLYDTIKNYDCLIMPFQVNDIVKAVDPVKLYEYIAFGKCIVSIWYEEIERFDSFVYFYKNEDEYIELMQELSSNGFPTKYTKQQQVEFLEQNNWKERYQGLLKNMKLMELTT